MEPRNALITATQAASILSITRQAVRYRARKKLMPAIRNERGQWLFTIDTVARALAEKKAKVVSHIDN